MHFRVNYKKNFRSAENKLSDNQQMENSHASRSGRQPEPGREASALHSHAKHGNEIAFCIPRQSITAIKLRLIRGGKKSFLQGCEK
ncbi:Uncharacterized protein dnm_031880 [Desulfonema magnum]|uniref:Uncharacterized protein n=1 Tax=Desulfonema magnum TaxID=45655 RepID=A0A975BL99_9BACT|nr:Uncharacterized protein dnm_031880 [Desulfonema magnum]